MRKLIISMFLLCLVTGAYAFKGFGIDGNLVAGFSGSEMVYNPSIDGRIQWNDNFSTILGVGLYNSGVKDLWTNETENSTTFTAYKLSSNYVSPTLHLSLRGQIPVFNAFGRQFYLYAEPKLIFMLYSGRELSLYEYGMKKQTDPITGEASYTENGDPVMNTLKSECHPDFYGSVSGGLSFEIKDNFEMAVGYGYSNIDGFKYVRDKNIHGTALSGHLPGAGYSFINVSIRVNYDL